MNGQVHGREKYLKRDNIGRTGPDDILLQVGVGRTFGMGIKNLNVQATVRLYFNTTVTNFENACESPIQLKTREEST